MRSFNTSRLLSLFVVFVLLLGIALPAKTQAEGVHYVALGDSLAAGQVAMSQDGKVVWDKGFSGYIRDYLESNGVLGSYTNKFAVSGYTTQNVLDDITANKEVEGNKLQDALKAATFISVTAGANDILREAEIDKVKRTVTLEPAKAAGAILKIQGNLANILKQIKALNSTAKIYVSGYYNPFPDLSADQQEKLLPLLKSLNGTIKYVAESNGAAFVNMEGVFDASKETYLPNPLDIHPSLEGYKLMADRFIDVYNGKVEFKFVDVPKGYPYYNEIKELVENRVMTGVSETHFAPKEAIKRSDVAQALFNYLPMDKSLPPNPGFTDVPTTHPNYMAIAKLTQVGVFVKAEKFNPNAPLTRAQMAKIFVLAFNLKATSASNFKDVTSKHWAKEFVDALVSAKITTGYGDNTYKPGVATSREHFALFLLRSAGKVQVSTVNPK